MAANEAPDELVSLFSVGSILLRRLRLIVALGFLGALLGLLSGLTSAKLFSSSASFVPQNSEASGLGLSALAGQFGVRVPGAVGTVWTTGVYVELLTSRSMLEAVALDTLTVSEEGGRVAVVADLFGVAGGPAPVRALRGALELRKHLSIGEDRRLNMVRVTVTTRWPSVSFTVLQRLLDRVNTFNIETRQAFAAAERRFIESQTAEAQESLRRAEDQLERFDQSNRGISTAPTLAFARDRLQREVNQQQQIFTALRQSLDDARIRERRGMDAITIIDRPLLPAIRNPRGSIGKGLLGGVTGALFGIVVALVSAQLAAARRRGSGDVQEFFGALADLIPSRLRSRRAGRRD